MHLFSRIFLTANSARPDLPADGEGLAANGLGPSGLAPTRNGGLSPSQHDDNWLEPPMIIFTSTASRGTLLLQENKSVALLINRCFLSVLSVVKIIFFFNFCSLLNFIVFSCAELGLAYHSSVNKDLSCAFALQYRRPKTELLCTNIIISVTRSYLSLHLLRDDRQQSYLLLLVFHHPLSLSFQT